LHVQALRRRWRENQSKPSHAATELCSTFEFSSPLSDEEHMTPISLIPPRRWIPLVLVSALVLPSTGCVAAAVTAAVAGAGAAGYVYYQGAVPRDYPKTMDETWAAAVKAVEDLQMKVETAQHDNDGATIETTTGTGEHVQIVLEPRTNAVPADGQWTHVSIRVSWFGNDQVSERLLNQIAVRLGLPPQNPPGGQTPADSAVQQTVPPPLAQGRPVPVATQTAPPPLATH
jgi:hypothetical protein